MITSWVPKSPQNIEFWYPSDNLGFPSRGLGNPRLALGGQPWCCGSPWSLGCRGKPVAGPSGRPIPAASQPLGGWLGAAAWIPKPYIFVSKSAFLLGVQILDLESLILDFTPFRNHFEMGSNLKSWIWLHFEIISKWGKI